MARYTKDQFLRDLAAYSVGITVGAKNTAKFLAFAGKSGIRLAGIGARRAAVPVATGALGLARANPGIATGLTLAQLYQMGLLDAPIERAKDVTAEALFEAGEFLPQQTPEEIIAAMQRDQGIKRPKKVTKYNRAVKAGMAAAKASQYFGKKGTLNSPKKAFVTVNRVASKVNRGKKVSAKGVSGKIARAVRRILK
jgi:hypothetical protein